MHLPLSMLITAILGFLAPLAAYTSYYFIFAVLVAQVVSKIFVLPCLAASSDNDNRASVRELPIPPWTHIFQDGFQVASEAGSTQHVIKPRLLYFYDISGSLLLYFSAALQEQFWHCLLAGFSSTIIRGRWNHDNVFWHQNIKKKKRPLVEILNLWFSNLPV